MIKTYFTSPDQVVKAPGRLFQLVADEPGAGASPRHLGADRCLIDGW